MVFRTWSGVYFQLTTLSSFDNFPNKCFQNLLFSVEVQSQVPLLWSSMVEMIWLMSSFQKEGKASSTIVEVCISFFITSFFVISFFVILSLLCTGFSSTGFSSMGFSKVGFSIVGTS